MLTRIAAPAGAAIRVAAGILWILEGYEKYKAGFGSADILLVADGVMSNSRTPWWLTPVADAMHAIPGVFGIVIPLLEVLLGIALVAGVLPRLVALGSIATLMLYWASDQLIAQYPIIVILSALVLAIPASARFGVPDLIRRRRDAGQRTLTTG